MKHGTVILLIGMLTVLNTVDSRSQKAPIGSAEAVELWEKVIAAKGGREAIDRIGNILETRESEGRTSRGRRYYERRVDLYVFPNRWWTWDSPGWLEDEMTMYNWSTGKRYLVGAGGYSSGLISLTEDDTSLAGITPETLLENRWNRAKPMRVYEAKSRNRSFLAIETRLAERRIDYLLDKSSLLPVEVRFVRSDGTTENTSSLSDYIEVEGLRMPSKVSIAVGDLEQTYRCSYRFNVDFDPAIFEHPPDFSLRENAWRRRGSS